MTLVAPAPPAVERRTPTVWGLTPYQIHDRFWASFGVQVVRQRERSEIVEGAELFLLCEAQTLVTFRIAHVLDALNWLQPDVLLLRVKDARRREYREVAAVDDEGRFQGFRRMYAEEGAGLTRVALTPDPGIARMWQNGADSRSGWRELKREVDRAARASQSVSGHLYNGGDDAEVMACVEGLIEVWKQPDTTIGRVQRLDGSVWLDEGAAAADGAQFVGPVWVGCGRTVPADAYVVGPTVMWDDPENRPSPDHIGWQEIAPTPLRDRGEPRRRVRAASRPGKRAFDVVFAALVLLFTLPIYPLVMLAILLEDGRPFFFAHRRETRGGREFGCLKFRSMRKDAEKIKAELARENLADGPQFFMHDDPRLTRVGRFLRDTQIDELPQFWNVLVGDMSVVGPRPSPRRENQFCPAWREARLSVRPGVTGLWQVQRTRIEGLDFQEWIRFDLEYVEKNDWRMDLSLIWRTVFVVLSKLVPRNSP